MTQAAQKLAVYIEQAFRVLVSMLTATGSFFSPGPVIVFWDRLFGTLYMRLMTQAGKRFLLNAGSKLPVTQVD